MTGMFKDSPARGMTREQELDVVPLTYFLAHPLSRKWWAKIARSGLGATPVTDLAIGLANGYEGIVQFMALLGHAGIQGANQGISWQILLDGSTPVQARWGVGAGVATATLDESGRFDYLQQGDGAGNSWGEIDLWLPENSQLQVTMINNGGAADTMGWTMWGMFWPISVRDNYHEQRKKGRG